jgi:hypothetical protein
MWDKELPIANCRLLIADLRLPTAFKPAHSAIGNWQSAMNLIGNSPS